ncbi:MAG: GNAT family N-acetyltransferase [Peptococcaceae bacterium]|nr:GNAT family N-acetyltransferase [Peptococcaceae bacterium]
MEFRQTRSGEEAGIMEITDQAKAYFKARGIDQWQKGYPDLPVICGDRELGQSYVLVENGRILAAAALTFGREPAYETLEGGRWLNEEGPYGAVHRIAVEESRKGQGLAGRLIRQAEELCRKKGAISLRSDTHRENVAMQRLLMKHSFQYCGIVRLVEGAEAGEKRLAFEKLLTEELS